jgi:O-antigen/teichoic acid export membrane protein
MNLLKTSVLNGIAVLVKTATMFILNKILAVYVGPSGYAAIGQFQNFIQMATSFAGGAINTAVVKYTAEYYEDENKQRTIWQSAGTIVLGFSLLFAALILLFQKPLSLYIFHSYHYQSVFVWFAAFLVFFNFNALFLAILNGKKEIKKLVLANILGSLLSLGITGFLAYQWHLYGALIALCIYQSVAFFVTLSMCYKSDWFRLSYLFGKVDKDTARKFLGFALMALVSVFFGNIAQIILRNIIIHSFDLQHAGYWDAMNKLSGGYLMFATTIIGVYYLPKLSELKTYNEIRHEVNIGYKYILPIASITALMIFIFKESIVRVLFTDNFLPMLELLKWQLLGDVIKIGSWIVSYVMMGRAMTKIFVITESIFALSIIPLTWLSIKFFGFKGIAFAFAINCLIYWIVCSISVFSYLRKN